MVEVFSGNVVNFIDGFSISRDQGKGNYLIVATYLQHFSAQKELPSWINNDPVVHFGLVTESDDGSVFISGRVENGIAGEEVSIAIFDPNNSNTATYVQTTNTKAQFALFIDSTEAKQAFPTSGDYTIVVTHIPTGVTGSTTLTYTVV
jgi:hypothetical protein